MVPWYNPATRYSRSAFTLVELLVVIAILGTLFAIVLSAVQASREAARATQCKNNLRQLSHALLLHDAAHKHLPSGGWSYRWLAEPGAGDGKKQPGSWIYSILSELEEQPVQNLGIGLTGAARHDQLAQLAATPLAVLNCPTRRAANRYPVPAAAQPRYYMNLPEDTGPRLTLAGRSDYGACTGGGEPPASGTAHDRGLPVDGPGPDTLQEADEWDKVDSATGLNRWESTLSGAANGAIITRYPIALRRVTDGASKTYLVGEKFLETEHYDSGFSNNDDQNAYVGFDRDNQVSARYTSLRDTSSSQFAAFVIQNGEDFGFHFGSAHPAVFHVARCDGSVLAVSFDIDRAVHRAAGSRDGSESVGGE